MERIRRAGELLASEGVTKHQIGRAVQAGELVHVRRGSYASPDELSAVEQHVRLILATLLEIGEDSVVSHLSAAVLHGIQVPTDRLDRVWVTRAAGGNGRRGPVLHLRHCRLDRDEVVDLDGIPVTSLGRTVTDLARLLPLEWGVIACDRALGVGLEREALLDWTSRARGWPGAGRAVTAARFADGRSESPLESVSRLQIARLGYPPPTLQYEVFDSGQVVATCDFCWEEEGLVGECDGKAKYSELLRPGETAADAVMREKRREERVRGTGLWISRWGWAEAWNRPALQAVLDRGFRLAPGHSIRPAS